jgi:hypothetical protein
VSSLAVWYFAAHGWLYYYGDAEAHLNQARRLVDSSTPGWEQLGVPWLPLPHLLIALFAADTWLWRSGLAGSIPSAACWVTAGLFLFSAAREVFTSWWAAWTALLVFLLNPNGLYLQSTAMTESFFAAGLCGLLYFSVRFRRTGALADVVGAGICALAGTLTRYDGWVLLPFCAGYLLTVEPLRCRRGSVTDGGRSPLANGRQSPVTKNIYRAATATERLRACALFCAIAGIGPVAWFYYNWWLTSDPLYFLRGPGSAQAIQGASPYPGLHDWYLARVYYRTCVELVLGNPLFWLALIGLVFAIARRAWWPALLLALTPAFYIWNMHSGSSPIFMPGLWPHSWYNTRYGLAALPAAAFLSAAMTRTRWGLLAVLIAVYPWVRYPSHENWITWKESERNSISRREWTSQAATYLETHAHPGEHFAAGFGDLIGIFRTAGIPIQNVFHQGNTMLWDAAVQRPELFLNTVWVVCQQGDQLCGAVAHAGRYRLADRIAVEGAPVLEIYRNEYSVSQSARREE